MMRRVIHPGCFAIERVKGVVALRECQMTVGTDGRARGMHGLAGACHGRFPGNFGLLQGGLGSMLRLGPRPGATTFDPVGADGHARTTGLGIMDDGRLDHVTGAGG